MNLTNTLFAKANYGPIICGKEYRVIGEGTDWYQVQANGRGVYCPNWVFGL